MALRTKISGIVFGAADPSALAEFYHTLLDWPYGANEPGWITLRPPHGGPGLSFQEEIQHVPAVWPAGPGDQQMQVHLDIEVDDLELAGGHAVAAGATLAEFQPQQYVRVFQDPAGHPFCLWVQPPQ